MAHHDDPSSVKNDVVVAAIDELIASWDRSVSRGSINLRPRADFSKNAQQAAAIITLTQHLYELAKVVRPHLPDDLPITLVPVAREALETGIWVVWLDQHDDASVAALNEMERNRKFLAESMVESNFLPPGETLKLPSWTNLPTEVGAHARRFDQMTKALGLREIYVYYRILSGHSHPGVEIMDSYVDLNEQDEPVFRTTAKRDNRTQIVARILPLLLLKSARIVNYMTRERERRSELQAIARMLRVDVDDLFAS